MDLKDLQSNWDVFGRIDPLWAILSFDGKEGNKWDLTDFFRSGEEEVTHILRSCKFRDCKITFKRALDFGCGAGRLTQALASHFEQVSGVDIASSMIELARKHNSYPQKCTYYLNEVNDLSLFADRSFEFIYSNIVLQHMEPRYSKNYIKEFLRLICRGGVLIFQQPTVVNSRVFMLKEESKRVFSELDEMPQMEMYGIERDEVIELVEQAGAKVVGTVDRPLPSSVVMTFYFVSMPE